ncbi:MAG: Mur ligase family protein [Bacteroidales bacterium]
MKVHFIAIGGSAMHNLAIALHKKGYTVSGSDDQVFDPSRSRLAHYGLLPSQMGWNTDRIHQELDAVIVGMHARADNPELHRARALNLPVYSYPEFLYNQSKDKKRIVIGGSHGKTTITSIILHVLNYLQIDTDYMVGAQLRGFEVMVRLSENAPYMVMEGDEYLSSPVDPRPKFHLYAPHIAVISGIAWDHINVFKTYEDYLEQFRTFIHCIEEGGSLIYCADDPEVKALCEAEAPDTISLIPYGLPAHETEDGVTCLIDDQTRYPIHLFGHHNLLNINAARIVCHHLGLNNVQFFRALAHFRGASKRLEVLYTGNGTRVIRDFAHAPSKVKATIEAVKQQFPAKKLVACLELFTFSSLNADFLPHYNSTMDPADIAFVYFNPHALKMKKLPPITREDVKAAFAKQDMKVYTDKDSLEQALQQETDNNSCLLLMSSGDFGGLNIQDLIQSLQ